MKFKRQSKHLQSKHQMLKHQVSELRKLNISTKVTTRNQRSMIGIVGVELIAYHVRFLFKKIEVDILERIINCAHKLWSN